MPYRQRQVDDMALRIRPSLHREQFASNCITSLTYPLCAIFRQFFVHPSKPRMCSHGNTASSA